MTNNLAFDKLILSKQNDLKLNSYFGGGWYQSVEDKENGLYCYRDHIFLITKSFYESKETGDFVEITVTKSPKIKWIR